MVNKNGDYTHYLKVSDYILMICQSGLERSVFNSFVNVRIVLTYLMLLRTAFQKLGAA